MSKQGPHFSPHRKAGLILVHIEKLKPTIKGQISGKLISSGISHVAFASVYSGENPSEEVDDYDNYYYYYEFIARNDDFSRAPEIDFR